MDQWVGWRILERLLGPLMKHKCLGCGAKVHGYDFIHVWDECVECHSFRKLEWEQQDRDQALHEATAKAARDMKEQVDLLVLQGLQQNSEWN